MSAGVVLLDAVRDGWEPVPAETVSEWADRFRFLSDVASAEPGPWRTDRTPYLREPMDRLSPLDPTRRVVLMFGTQLGKTESGNNWLGHIIHRAPAPVLMVLPTVDIAKRVSKQRIAPMLETTPVLRERVREARSRDSNNTVQVKAFDGGLLILTGANSSAGLRSMPVRDLFCDEVDAYPGDLDGQGDPVSLAEARTSNFPDAKSLLTSSPTIHGISRIEREFLKSDQRRYFLPCPSCGHFDFIRWENIRWEEGRPETAKLACVACGELLEERHKTAMLAAGEWRPTAEGEPGVCGYHLPAMYAPLGWKSWERCVRQFTAAKEDPFALKTFVNTVLAETWEERGDSLDATGLKARLERFPAEVPEGVGLLVGAVDVQGDRLEVLVVGYGAAEEGWVVAFTQLYGDPAGSQVWRDLDAFVAQDFSCQSGRRARVELAVIDSGGAHTESVYKFVAARQGSRACRFVAIKGGSESGKPLVARPSTGNRYHLPLYVLCVDTGKEQTLSRLRISTPSPGFVHLPAWLDDEFLAQLTAEKAVRKYVRGRGAVRVWVKVRERNEALDLMVYALAALYICGAATVRSLPERAARLALPPSDPTKPDEPAAPRGRVLPRRPGGGWVGGW